jgi:hypothetical protein
VTTLVGQDPQTGAEETLDEGVQSPETCSYCCGWNILGCEESVGEVKDGG